jgi:prepilin-type N-terminal cleavage/methylation domain-containing protein/prepilin-type processing-associated H-X9-DG protein
MFDSRTKLASGSSRRNSRSPSTSRAAGCRHVQAAFTLSELLVVLAVIGILATLLATSFNNTKARSQKVVCLNNLHQMQWAWRLYVDDNDDLLPINTTTDNPLLERIYGRLLGSNAWACGNPKEDISPANLIRGSLFPYTGRSIGVYRCPVDRSTVIGRTDALRNRSYTMSAYLAGDDQGVDPRVKAKDSELISPSPEHVFVFVEEHEDSPWLGAFWVLPREKMALSSVVNWTSLPSDRHNQGCNLSFADGHVQYWKWFWPKKPDPTGTRLTSNGHELRDLQRLQNAVPNP